MPRFAENINATIRKFAVENQSRANAAEAECDRLRGLLAIAREALLSLYADHREYPSGVFVTVGNALRRSDPDALPPEMP